MSNTYEEPRYNDYDPDPRECGGNEWEPLAAQIDYWADLDREYWRQRRETEYRLFLERKYGIAAS